MNLFSAFLKSSLFPSSFLAGIIIEINNELQNTPQLVNTDPEDAGWYMKIKLEKTDELIKLMNFDQYKEIIK